MSKQLRARKAILSPWMMLAAAGCAVAALVAVHPLDADEPSSTVAEAEIAEAEDDVEDKYRRLPPYYAEVVTEAQKDNIYTIQKRYADKIEALKAELRKVIVERDAAIAALLTAEQKQVVERIAADRQEELEVLKKFREQRAKERGEESATN